MSARFFAVEKNSPPGPEDEDSEKEGFSKGNRGRIHRYKKHLRRERCETMGKEKAAASFAGGLGEARKPLG